MVFDLEKARAEVATASARRFSESREQARIFCAEEILPDALDEIERLRGYEIAARDLSADLTKVAGDRDEQAARIKELEDALVEMVATNPCNIPTLCDVVHDELMCLALDGNCDFWKGCPQKNELRKAARKQLQAEGKIGPDADAKPREGLYGKYCISKADGSPVDPNADYFVLRLDTDPVARRAAREYSYVTPDRDLARGLQDCLAKYDPQLKDCMNIQFFGLEKPHCWQITEERKAALWHAINVLKENDIMEEPEEHLWDEEVTVLQAMLTEAGQ